MDRFCSRQKLFAGDSRPTSSPRFPTLLSTALNSSAFRATASSKMGIRTLRKLTVNRANNAYLRFRVFVIDSGVIVFRSVNRSRPPFEFGGIKRLGSAAFFAPSSLKVRIWSLREPAVLRTNDGYRNFCRFVIDSRVIVFPAVNLSRSLNESNGIQAPRHDWNLPEGEEHFKEQLKEEAGAPA